MKRREKVSLSILIVLVTLVGSLLLSMFLVNYADNRDISKVEAISHMFHGDYKNYKFSESDLLDKDWLTPDNINPSSAYRFLENGKLNFGTEKWTSRGAWYLKGDSIFIKVYDRDSEYSGYKMVSPVRFNDWTGFGYRAYKADL